MYPVRGGIAVSIPCNHNVKRRVMQESRIWILLYMRIPIPRSHPGRAGAAAAAAAAAATTN
jgi:hypothetical protein